MVVGVIRCVLHSGAETGTVSAIKIIRTELDAVGLGRATARGKDVAAARRMLALALVLEGASRTKAARAAGMDRQTLRD